MSTNAKLKEPTEGSIESSTSVKKPTTPLKSVSVDSDKAPTGDIKPASTKTVRPKAKAKIKSTSESKENATSDLSGTDAFTSPVKVEAKTSTAKPSSKPQGKRPPKKRFSKSEHIKNQSNPKSILVGTQKTLNLRYEYCSDILHEYLQMNQATMLAAYERLAGLLRLVATDKPSYSHVNEWITTNLSISQEQVSNMQQRRSSLSEDCTDEIENLNISVPESYHTEFQASHPVCHKMLAVLKLIDAELNASEDLFMAGIIDDSSYTALRTEATSIIRGSVDRIYKATSPGTREGGRFTPSQLASWIRSGNKMLFADVPKDLLHLVNQKDS
jgi:hypothetical protein